MQSADILQTIAELSIGFAGFTSIVAVFGRRATGEWKAIDRFRLWQMLVTSLASLLLAMFPLVLMQLGVSERASWGAASGLLAAFFVFWTVASRRQIARLPTEDEAQIIRPLLWLIQTALAAVVGCLLLNAVGVAFERESGPYVLGLFFLLALSAFQFTRLLEVVRRDGGSGTGAG